MDINKVGGMEVSQGEKQERARERKGTDRWTSKRK